jgi:capsular polysaccharide transport system permease protein
MRLRKASYFPALISFALVVGIPTVMAAVYYYVVAADRYVSEIRYSVRGGGAIERDGGGGGLVDASAALAFAADSFILENYLDSVQALADIEERVPIREMLARDGGDPVRRYDPDAPIEEVLDFWRAAVTTRFDAITGITTLSVSMYDPQDAQKVGEALLDQMRVVVDSLSEQARRETLRYVEAEFSAASASLEAARRAIEEFRLVNRIISPEERVDIAFDIIGSLASQLTSRRVELRGLLQRTPNSPRIAILRDEIQALEEQMLDEVARRGDTGDGPALPGQLTSYDELESSYQIARDTFISTLALRQQAAAAAALSKAELVVFVRPREPSVSTEPRRLVEVFKVFGVAAAIWIAGRVFTASI